MELVTDVLIVGSGAAGLYSALNIASDLKVAVITKRKADECNSYLAQGGISKAKDNSDIEAFIEDTLKAGQYKNDANAVRVLAEESIENINELVRLGVPFDMEGGEFEYTREGAHRIKRIVHCHDETGKVVTSTLLDEVRKRKNITIYEDTCLVDLLTRENTCFGGIAERGGRQINIYSKYTILALGGIGGIFKNSTNVRTLTGDGIAIALKYGIELKDLNFIQIHPTALYEKEPGERRILISESLRGEGAKLKNVLGERFVDELLPRDVVAKAIFNEEKKTGAPHVWLDPFSMSSEYIKKRFSGIYSQCMEKGIDITKEMIPVTPVQHYFMGGIKVDTCSRTSMKKLFACGEASCTGVHGANRLASNSLLEAIVFSKRAAIYINKNISREEIVKLHAEEIGENIEKYKIDNKKAAINEFKKIIGELKNELVNC